MKNPVNRFEIHVQDVPRAKAFYERAFAASFRLLHEGELEMWAFAQSFEQYGASGVLVRMCCG